MRSGSRRAIGLGAAVVVVVGTVGAIILFGYVPLPPFPPIRDTPRAEIPGTVAYTTYGREGACVMQLPAAGGTASEVYCRAYGPEEVAWTPDGKLVVVSYEQPGGPTLVVVDPATGERIGDVSQREGGDVGDWSYERTVRQDGARLVTDPRPGPEAVVSIRWKDGTLEPVIAAEGPRDYDFTTAIWSPDGRWILAADSRGRLVVAAVDGSAGPFLLAELEQEVWMGAQLAWFIPGDPRYTIDVGNAGGA